MFARSDPFAPEARVPVLRRPAQILGMPGNPFRTARGITAYASVLYRSAPRGRPRASACACSLAEHLLEINVYTLFHDLRDGLMSTHERNVNFFGFVKKATSANMERTNSPHCVLESFSARAQLDMHAKLRKF
ncbi:hypothetical protein EVAR_40770_1 [Eumeta japonica]|uniref:Uncharacterized protein n=1 Tax=Eumeta variegata TaxID=151549 RepID=A0A4C1X4K9_EUMVA|nr:hypothetical protein EVAR_40770_1 [Eumeta japonica]